jgi:hypothetical protein
MAFNKWRESLPTPSTGAGRQAAGALHSVRIQMAGPHLTPAAVAAALATTTCPDPGAASAPAYQARVGFQQGDHDMVNDFAGFWLDTSANPSDTSNHGVHQNYEDYQMLCYLQLGARWTATTWPVQDRFLTGTCR